ncbi:ESX-1 secretion-associated protein [Actinoplanes sp. TBRC 11911]|uniref:type VII secretion target n=1 Tax=Actinoplanes sp. TBRC 11911 TaxID=2729386 RepID=UPI00145E8ED4|nr:type VII secretion target [Actinoplanes sp. TBRC 11911]NMO57582.1 ESX-1 secretion-associated protein [Actinoplanes sp. TBRC 11911]
MSRPVQVTPEALRRHGTHLDAVADDLATARQAADSTRPGPEAYGKLCVIVPAMLDQLQAPLVGAIDAAAQSVRDTADALIGAASDYEFTDETAAAAIRESGGGR